MRTVICSRPTPVAVAILAALQAATLQVHAADAPSQQQLPKISVGADEVNEYKPEILSSPKYTELALDTPQSVTVIPAQVMKDQNLLTMRDILSTVPGITFGAGEGGGGYGDSVTIRGFTGSSDITIDGVRDSAQYTRSDSFNLEQVEVVNGASSVYSGAGSVGGSVNLVSKVARQGDRSTIGVGAGTDSYGRVTADINRDIGEQSAVRVNVMAHRNDVPGRDFEKFERWGIAPSLALGLGTDTTVTLTYLHQSDDNVPQYGVPFYAGGPLPGVDSSNYYGYNNIDRQEIDTDAFTAIIDHRFSDRLSVRNLSRVQSIGQVSIVDATQGTWCLPGNVTPTGTSCTVTTNLGTTAAPQNVTVTVPVGQYLPSGPRGYVRDTTNELLYNQTDFTGTFATGAIEHTVVAGFSFAHETFELDTGSLFRNADGTNPFIAPNHLPFMNLYEPNSRYAGPINRTLTGKTDGQQDSAALYLFDTLKFSEQWQFNAGIRYDHVDGSSTAYTVTQAATNGGLPTMGTIGAIASANAPAKNADNLLSYRAGLIFKPVEAGTVYLSYGNSKTPSKASVNGSCTAVQTVTNNVGTGNANCNVDPETAVSYELGTKWDLFDAKLALTAAIFRNDRKDYRVNDPDPTNLSGQQSLDGEARVDGVLLGLSGAVLENLFVSANYSYLDSEVLQGVANFSAGLGRDYTKGDRLTNVPKHSLSLWTTYNFPIGLQVGYGATYQDELYLTQHSATNINGPLVTAADYVTHRAMAGYNFGRKASVQLNITNLFDKEYYTRIRNNGWATPGDGRSFVVSGNYNF